MADTALGLGLGERVELGGLELEVVGLADQVTWYFGTPTLFLAFQDAQALCPPCSTRAAMKVRS